MPGDDIRSVKRRFSPELMRRDDVSGFGVERDETGAEVLVLHVSTSDPRVLAELPRELGGYPVRIVQSGPFGKLGA